MAREKWGGIQISEHGVWQVLCRMGLNTRGKRLALIARHRDPYERALHSLERNPRSRHCQALLHGCVERVQLTILEECWRPSFARSLVPKLTALRPDLDEYLHYYNTDRAHTGRHNQGRVPADIVYGARKMGAAR